MHSYLTTKTGGKKFFTGINYKGMLLNTKPIVEVYKTNVQTIIQAIKIKSLLLEHFPDCKINFDLEDCDRILRIETLYPKPDVCVKLLNKWGFTCEELTD